MTRTWAIAQSVMPPDLASALLDDLRYTDLVAGYYVNAPLPVLIAINDFSLWFFVWDDRHDHDIRHRRGYAWSRLRDALHDALDDPQAGTRRGDPPVSAFADCVTRLCGTLSSRWAARFTEHFHATIDAYDQEFRNRTARTVPTVEEYLALRQHTFGMRVWIDCLELAAGFHRGETMASHSSIMTAPGALPLLGHGIPLTRDPLGFLAALPASGDLVQIRLGPKRAVVVCDPQLLRRVLLDDRTFDKGGPFFDRVREILGDGLATCSHSQHRRQRRLLQPAFHSPRLRDYAPAMTAQTLEVINHWHDNQIIDVLADMAAITSRTLAVTMFSGTLPDPALQQAVQDIRAVAGYAYRRMLTPPPLDRLPTPGNRRYRQAAGRLRATVSQAISDRKTDPADHRDLLSAMIGADDPGTCETRLSATEIIDNLVTFILAGSESTASTLAWALHLLAQHPAIADRVHAEADTVLAGSPARHDHLPGLTLISRVVTETLRLYPPGWMFTRTVTTTTDLGGHTVPAGTSILYSPYILHHSSDCYQHPERFDPDRWDSTSPAHDAYVPFGTGARKCIGDQFSLIEATLTLATIAARWQLQPLPANMVRPSLAIALHPRKLRMRAISRADAPAARRPGTRGRR